MVGVLRVNDTEVGLLKFYKKQDFKFREKE